MNPPMHSHTMYRSERIKALREQARLTHRAHGDASLRIIR